jgi:hypothetical protein
MPRNPQIDPPDWWEWNLAFTPHVESRMDEREFSELDLRAMIADATDLVSSRRPILGKHAPARSTVDDRT